MKSRKAAYLMAIVLLAISTWPDMATGAPASAPTQRVGIAPKMQTLFRCNTDNAFTLRRQAKADEGFKSQYAVSGRRSAPGEMQLTIDPDRHAMTLFSRAHGAPTRAYVLRDVEQGSSPGSGAGLRADTTIRGKSGASVFTLFASNADAAAESDAALQLEGKLTVLLVCARGQYVVHDAKTIGRRGLTNIYNLAADGWAVPMKTLPVEPRHP